MLTETGIISLATLTFAFLTGVLGVCYKSKCSHMKCCCIDIVRDTEVELKEDMVEIQRRISVNNYTRRGENVINQV